MTRRRTVVAMMLLIFAVAACKKEGGAAGAPGASSLSKYPGTEEGAKQLLPEIRGSDAKAMTLALRPTSADYKAVFTDDVAGKLEEAYAKLWSDPNAVIGADPANTELALWKATSEELQQWTGEASANFPGGYKRVAAKLKPGLVVYRWKYVKPGETAGMAYDGLIHVNGRWSWYPKPWRMMGGDGGE
ncbi:MAG TPA: hypothetical protein PKU97_07375 [Kofleriaceae bacterium]|nr:hypothetical protein [Kofleriaceae bacterium]